MKLNKLTPPKTNWKKVGVGQPNKMTEIKQSPTFNLCNDAKI